MGRTEEEELDIGALEYTSRSFAFFGSSLGTVVLVSVDVSEKKDQMDAMLLEAMDDKELKLDILG